MRTEDVLDSIDHALGDWSVSGDAMRWSPEPPKRSELSVTIEVDTSAFVEAINALWDAFAPLADVLKAAGTAIAKLFPAAPDPEVRHRIRTDYRRRSKARCRRAR